MVHFSLMRQKKKKMQKKDHMVVWRDQRVTEVATN